jgi:hypothetical protein
VILAVRSKVSKRMLTNIMKESAQEVIEFPVFSSDILDVILEYLFIYRKGYSPLETDQFLNLVQIECF